jgi:hypothetical protein
VAQLDDASSRVDGCHLVRYITDKAPISLVIELGFRVLESDLARP